VLLEVLGTTETGNRLQDPHWQYVPLRDSSIMLCPLSLPHMSNKTSEIRGKAKKDAQTFENNSIFWAPKVAKRLQAAVGHNMYRFRFISENVELVCMPKILGRVDFEFVPVCFRRCREICVKMRIVPESQTFPFVFEWIVEFPQNLWKACTAKKLF
jgi:hypothetical protein